MIGNVFGGVKIFVEQGRRNVGESFGSIGETFTRCTVGRKFTRGP
jgi:hypothetical protein